MRNIRIFVEFASVVMPGGVLLLLLTLLIAPPGFLSQGPANSAIGIVAGLAMSFAAGHLLQGVAQVLVEPIWIRINRGWAVDWPIRRFAGHERGRYLSDEQVQQLEIQFPAKLGVSFPPETADRKSIESAVAHAEAFLYSMKANEHLDDIVADYKLTKGLFTAFLLVTFAIAASFTGLFRSNAGEWTTLLLLVSIVGAWCGFVRMEYHSMKYAQSVYLLLLTTPTGREGGGGRGNGGGGGGMPIGGFARGGPRTAAPAQQDEEGL